jgi:hypothetical protein
MDNRQLLSRFALYRARFASAAFCARDGTLPLERPRRRDLEPSWANQRPFNARMTTRHRLETGPHSLHGMRERTGGLE